MNTIKNKNNHKKIIIVLVAVLACLGLFGVLVKTGVILKTSENPTGTAGPTPEQQKQSAEAAADAKQQLIEGQKPGTNTSTDNTSQVTTVDLSAKQEATSSVTVFTTLHGYSSGTCDLKVTNGGKETSLTANVIYQEEFSSCAGFSVPIAPLGKGTWSIKLTVTFEGKTQSKTISFEVI